MLTDVLNDSSSKEFLEDVKNLAESLIAEYRRHDDSPDRIKSFFFFTVRIIRFKELLPWISSKKLVIPAVLR